MEENAGTCFFDLNDRRGSFIPHKITDLSKTIYIGGHPIEKESYAKVTPTNLEVYQTFGDFIPEPYVYLNQYSN